MLREFRSSVSARFDMHDARFEALEDRVGGLESRVGGLEGRIAELTMEVRDRTRTMETAILNSIRDLARDIDRRLTRLEG